MTLKFKDLWAPKGAKGQKSYVARANFMTMMRCMPPQVKARQPSPEKAPWHVQIYVDRSPIPGAIINVWPHRCKWQVDGEVAQVDNEDWSGLTGRICGMLAERQQARQQAQREIQ